MNTLFEEFEEHNMTLLYELLEEHNRQKWEPSAFNFQLNR